MSSWVLCVHKTPAAGDGTKEQSARPTSHRKQQLRLAFFFGNCVDGVRNALPRLASVMRARPQAVSFYAHRTAAIHVWMHSDDSTPGSRVRHRGKAEHFDAIVILSAVTFSRLLAMV